MLDVRLAGDHLYGKLLFTLTIVGDVFGCVFLCCSFSHDMSWMSWLVGWLFWV